MLSGYQATTATPHLATAIEQIIYFNYNVVTIIVNLAQISHIR